MAGRAAANRQLNPKIRRILFGLTDLSGSPALLDKSKLGKARSLIRRFIPCFRKTLQTYCLTLPPVRLKAHPISLLLNPVLARSATCFSRGVRMPHQLPSAKSLFSVGFCEPSKAGYYEQIIFFVIGLITRSFGQEQASFAPAEESSPEFRG